MNAVRAVAGHLPGLKPEEVQWQALAFGAEGGRVEIEVPVLSAPQMQALALRVRRAASTSPASFRSRAPKTAGRPPGARARRFSRRPAT